MKSDTETREAPITLFLENEEATVQWTAQLAACLTAPLVLTLSGEIGSGKTTLVRALLRNLGIKSAIKSPSFSIVESYSWNHWCIHHFDLYRIHQEEELEYIGFREYFSKQSICFIEWAEQASQVLNQADLHFNLGIKEAGREMQISALSQKGKKIVACLLGEQ